MQNSYSNKINFKHYRFCLFFVSVPPKLFHPGGRRERSDISRREGVVTPRNSMFEWNFENKKNIYICWYINLYMCVYKSVFIVNIKVTWGNSYWFSVLLPVFIVFIKRTFLKILNCLLIHNWIDMHLFDKLTVSDLRVTVINILLLKAEEKPTPEQLIIMEQIKSLYQF